MLSSHIPGTAHMRSSGSLADTASKLGAVYTSAPAWSRALPLLLILHHEAT